MLAKDNRKCNYVKRVILSRLFPMYYAYFITITWFTASLHPAHVSLQNVNERQQTVYTALRIY